MQLSQESVDEFKELFKKEYGVEYDDATAREAAQNLIGFFDALLRIDSREQEWKEKLKESPNGFGIDNTMGYSCRLCRNTNTKWEYWYDKNELKCPPCQRAIDEGIVPENVMHDKDSWMSMGDVRKKLDLHHSTIQKMIRTGELQARIIKNGKCDYFWVFLKKENNQLI